MGCYEAASQRLFFPSCKMAADSYLPTSTTGCESSIQTFLWHTNVHLAEASKPKGTSFGSKLLGFAFGKVQQALPGQGGHYHGGDGSRATSTRHHPGHQQQHLASMQLVLATQGLVSGSWNGMEYDTYLP